MRLIQFLLVTMLATTAAGQTNDFGFSPRSAEPKGGAEIHIFAVGTSLRFEAPQVFFGDVPSPRVTVVDDRNLTAVTPAHATGIVSLMVFDKGVSPLSTSPFVFEPVLEEIFIPIAYQPISASYGTRWVSEISVYNDSDDAVSIDREICSDFVKPVLCGRPVRLVSPHSTMRLEPFSMWADYPAMFILPPADHADRLHFTVRLRELSRDPDGPGTEIPVVRSRDFQQKQVWLPSIPTSVRFRSTLRVYTRYFNFTVRVRDNITGELLLERLINRQFPTDSDPFGTVALNDLLSSALVRAHENVRIEVASETPVWALLTLTDNESQRVQIFTPQ